MSTIKVDNIRIASESVRRPATGVAAAYAWVDMFNTPNGIKGKSLNSSSVTDNNQGSYHINLTSDMSSTLSVSNITSLRSSIAVATGNSGLSMDSVDAVRVITQNLNGANNYTEFCMSLHGDLA